ncbi:hypothetical protein LQW54_002688 [Pestalotiopsis sp. IQ-011]
MPSSESRKAIKAIKKDYGGPTHNSVMRALSRLVGLVRANVEDCRDNTMESFFQKHKAQLSWVRNLDDHTVTRLYQTSVAARVNLKCLRQDLPIEGPNAAPVRAWQESPLTKAIDDLVETLNERFGRSFPEVAWDWGMKAADDTDWEASEEEQEDISDVDNDQNNDMGMDQEEDGIDEAMEAMQLD